MNSLWRHILSIILSCSLATSPCAWAGADNDLLNQSRANARDLAKQVFVNLLEQVVSRATPYNHVLKHAQKILGEFNYRLNEIAIGGNDKFKNAYNQLLMESADLDDLLANDQTKQEQITSTIGRLVTSFQNLMIQLQSMAFNIRSHQQLLAEANEVVPKVISEVQEICRKGIAVYYVSSNLTHLTYTSPQMNVGFSMTRDYGQNESRTKVEQQSDMGLALFPIADSWGPDGRKYNAALSYGTWAATATALHLLAKVPIGLMLGLYAAGITAVFAFAVLMIHSASINDEASKQAAAIENVFWNRADSESVRGMVMEECSRVLGKFTGIPDIVSALASSPNSARVAEFAIKAKQADEFKQRIYEINERIEQRRQMLIDQHRNDPKPVTEDVIKNELTASAEVQELQKYVKSIGQDAIIDQLVVNLVRFSQVASQNVREFEKLAERELESESSSFQILQKQLPELIARRNKLFELARTISLQEADPEYAKKIQLEQRQQKEVAQLYLEWQSAYVSVVRSFLLKANEPPAQKTLTDVLTRLQQYSMNIKTSPPILRKLILRSQALLQITKRVQS